MKAARSTKLILVVAFNDDSEGTLRRAFDPREFRNEPAAIRFAKMIEDQHNCVVAWTRASDGERNILYSHGDVPEME